MIMAGRPKLKMTTHARWVQRKVMVYSPASQENCARRCGVLAGLRARGRNLTPDSQNLLAMAIPPPWQPPHPGNDPEDPPRGRSCISGVHDMISM